MAWGRATEADDVFPLDADDLVAPGGLKRLADVLDRHPEAAAAWGSIQSFGQLEYVHESRPVAGEPPAPPPALLPLSAHGPP